MELNQVRQGGGTPGAVTPVSAVMTPGLVRVPQEMPAEAVMALFLELGISGAPVVDVEGRALGMVSKTDILAAMQAVQRAAGPQGAARAELGPDWTAESLMARQVVCVLEDAPLSEAAARMAATGVHRLLVLDRDGRLVGILSALDIARWLARLDGFLDASAYRPHEQAPES